MKNPIWTDTYEVDAPLACADRGLDAVGLLGLLQDTALAHATDLGHGYEVMLEQGIFWALTRQRLVVQRWPMVGDTVKVRTWVRPLQGTIAIREFEVRCRDRVVATCSTTCVTVDGMTRRPAPFRLDGERMVFRTDGGLPYEARRIELRAAQDASTRITVRSSDLDLNEHVNNTRYARWALDALPPETLRKHRVDEYGVNFLAEARLGDVIVLTRGRLESGADERTCFQFAGVREGDERPLFVAEMRLSDRPLSSTQIGEDSRGFVAIC